MRRREAARIPVRVPPEIALAAKFPVGWDHRASAQVMAKLDLVLPDDPYRSDAVRGAQLRAWQVRNARIQEWADSEGLRLHEALELAREAAGKRPLGPRF